MGYKGFFFSLTFLLEQSCAFNGYILFMKSFEKLRNLDKTEITEITFSVMEN